MRNVLKQFGAKDTGSFKERFHSSLLKLTAVYVAILAIILFVSSTVTYSAFSTRLIHRYANVRVPLPTRPFVPPPAREDVQGDLVDSLLIVNGVLLILGGILSYGLAQITLEPLQQAYQRQQQFIGDASHELRTPLSILRTDIENQLADKSLSANLRAQITSNLEEVDRMGRIVNDLLTISRLDEPARPAVTLEKLELAPIINRSIERLRSLATTHEVSINYTSGEPLWVLSNEDLLLQVLSNVIKNAIIYNRVHGAVTITTAKTGRAATIAIADTGIGIAKEDLQKIFGRFYRTDQSRSRQTGGSGLGLSIVRSSMTSLRGTIDIESELGKGTIVTLTLPLA